MARQESGAGQRHQQVVAFALVLARVRGRALAALGVAPLANQQGELLCHVVPHVQVLHCAGDQSAGEHETVAFHFFHKIFENIILAVILKIETQLVGGLLARRGLSAPVVEEHRRSGHVLGRLGFNVLAKQGHRVCRQVGFGDHVVPVVLAGLPPVSHRHKPQQPHHQPADVLAPVATLAVWQKIVFCSQYHRAIVYSAHGCHGCAAEAGRLKAGVHVHVYPQALLAGHHVAGIEGHRFHKHQVLVVEGFVRVERSVVSTLHAPGDFVQVRILHHPVADCLVDR